MWKSDQSEVDISGRLANHKPGKRTNQKAGYKKKQNTKKKKKQWSTKYNKQNKKINNGPQDTTQKTKI
jgi:hypothetical protein